MVSERQIAANRINAKRSTGPKTELGKRRSSRNALRHGLLSKFVVLPTESEDEYNEFSREIAQDLAPIGALESLLADRIAAAAWRLRRACSIEAGMLSLEYYGVLISDAQARARSATRSNPLFLPLEEVEVVDPVEHGLALEEEGAARVLQSSDRERIGNAYQRICERGDGLMKLARYETAIQRNAFRSLSLLREIQARRIEADDA